VTQNNVHGPGSGRTGTTIEAIEFDDAKALSRLLVRGILLFGVGIGVAATHQAIQALIDTDVLTVTNYPPYAAFVTGMIALTAGLFAALAITWWRWQALLFRNTTHLKASNRYGPRWVRLGWLAPGPWFYMPKRMIDDAYFPRGRPGGVSTDLITGWWGLGWAMVTLILISAAPAIDPAVRIALSVSLLGVGAGLTGVTVAMVERLALGQIVRHGQLTGISTTPMQIHSFSWITAAASLTVGLGVIASLAIGYGYGFDNSVSNTTTAAPISTMLPGDCFNGDTTAVVTVVGCDDFHDGQLIERFDLPGTTYPGVEAVTQFSQTWCREQYEIFSGIGAQASEAPLLLVASDQTAWNNGVRTVHCVLGSSPPSPMRLSAENRVARTALANLIPAECYARDPDFVTFRSVDCSQDGVFEVDSVPQLSLLVDAAYPSNFDDIATSACPAPRTAFPPDSQQ